MNVYAAANRQTVATGVLQLLAVLHKELVHPGA